MKKQSLIKGTLILGIANIITRFLGIFFRIPLQNLIGDEGIGYYQLSYPLYAVFVSVSSGIPIAVSKMISERIATNRYEEVKEVLKKALMLMLFLSIGFTGIIFIFGKRLVYALNWNKKSYYSLIAICIAPIFIATMDCFRGFFQGMQNMTPTAISQFLEQLGRVIFGVGLAYVLLPKGVEYSAAGASLGASIGGMFGCSYLIYKYFRTRKELYRHGTKSNIDIMEELLRISIPISIGSAVAGTVGLIDSFLVPQNLLKAGYNYRQSTILYSQLTGKASVLINVPLSLSVALSSSLIPIISEDYILGNLNEVKSKISMAFKFSFVIAIPSFLGLFFLPLPILNLIFKGQIGGYNILKYSSIAIPFIVLTQTTTAILQGLGYYKAPIVNLFIGCVIKTILNYFLVSIPKINIYGAVLGTISAYIVSSVLNMRILRKKTKFYIDFNQLIFKPLCASTIMIICAIFIYEMIFLKTGNMNLACIVCILCAIIIYTILVFLFKIFCYNYVKDKFSKGTRRREKNDTNIRIRTGR